MKMKAKMITSTTSEVRRFCSDDGEGFGKGSGVDVPDMASGVVTVTPILVRAPPRFGLLPEIDPPTR